MVVRQRLLSAIAVGVGLLSLFPIASVAKAQHAVELGVNGRASAETERTKSEVVRAWLDAYRKPFGYGRSALTRGEQETFLQALAEKGISDRDFVLWLIRTNDPRSRQALGKTLFDQQVTGLSEADLPYEDRAELRRDPVQVYERIFNDFIYRLVTDPRTAERFKSPYKQSTIQPNGPKYEGPSMSALPPRKPWEKPRDPLKECYDKCRRDYFRKYGPFWWFNPGGEPYWACIATCNYDKRHGRLH